MASTGAASSAATPAPSSDKKKKKSKSKEKKSDRKKEKKSDRKRKKSIDGGGGGGDDGKRKRPSSSSSSSPGGGGGKKNDGDDCRRRGEAKTKPVVAPPDDDAAVRTETRTTGGPTGGAKPSSAPSTPSASPSRVVAAESTTTSSDASMTTTAVKIVVHPPDPTVDPVVASFPSGLPSSLLRTTSSTSSSSARGNGNDGGGGGRNDFDFDDDPPSFEFRRLRADKSRGKGAGAVKSIVGRDGACTYAASSSSASAAEGGTRNVARRRRSTRTYVGLYDKQKRTLTLRPAAGDGTVFALRQSVTNYEEGVSTDGMDPTSRGMSAVDRHRSLFESFGSAKKKRVLKSRAANVVSVESVVGSGKAMVEAVGGQGDRISKENRRALMDGGGGKGGGDERESKTDAVARAYEEARRAFLPPFNASASAPHEVYDPRLVAGDDVWDYLGRVVDACVEHHPDVPWRDALLSRSDRWQNSVLESLKSIRLETSAGSSKKTALLRIKCCLLLHYVLKFREGTKDDRRRKGRVIPVGDDHKVSKIVRGVPREVRRRLFDLFSTPSTDDDGNDGRVVSKRDRDRLSVHALILYLCATGPSMKVGNANVLAKDLTMEPRDLGSLAREAGCATKRSTTGATSVALTVPLTFPPPKRGRK